MTGPAEAAVRVCLLGELRAERGEVTYCGAELGSRKGRMLLAILAADRASTHSSAVLAAALWAGQQPDSADATIASLVSRLRRTLGAQVIVGARTGYRLGAPPDVDVDLAVAARLVTEAERRAGADQPGLAGAAAGAALALLEGGPAPAGEDDAGWAVAVRDELASLLRRARHVAAAAALATGDQRTARLVAEAAAAADPLDEEAVRALITALAAAGETGSALAVYERLRCELADQLGADPAPATQRLHESLLRGEIGTAHTAQARAVTRPALLGLAGRDTELGTLHGAWAAAAAGTGSLVLLTGAAGAGKTRLAEELTEVVGATGGAVLVTRCYEAEKALFLQPLVEAIASALASWPPAAIRAAVTDHLDALARLVPELRSSTGAVPARPGLADVERRRSIEAVSAFLRGLGATRPLLLVLDDLHNAGRSTVELLHYLRAELPTARLLVVATLRSNEGAEAIDALAPVATRIEIGGLSSGAVRTLADAAGQTQLAGAISRRTGGHALFVVEILRGLADGTPLPESLQAAVLTRVERLGPLTDTVLRAGSVLGASFEPRLTAELTATPLAETLRCCERALAAELLVTAGRDYEFANDVLREVIYATTAEPTRIAYHAHAADLLADRPEQVAAHATVIEDWERAARAWLTAAEQALDRFAATDAATLAGHALDAARRSGSAELLARSLLIRGRAGYVTGDYAACWTDLGAAVAAAREAGDPRLEMLALREQNHDPHVALGRPPAETEAPMRECLRIAESLGDRIREADALSRLAILATSRLDFVTALELGERAMRIGRTAGQRRALIHGLDAVKTANAYLGEPARLAPIVTELEPLERADGDLMLLQWTVFESCVVPLVAGDHAGAVARIETALALNRRSGMSAFEPFFLGHLGWLHRLHGDLDAAADIGARALAAGREHPHAWWQATAAAMYATTLVGLGRDAEARSAAERALPLVDMAGAEAYRLRCLAALAAATDSADALAEADALLHTVAAPAGSAWLLGADAYLGIAAAWVARGESGRAREALAPMRAAARRVRWSALVQLADGVGAD